MAYNKKYGKKKFTPRRSKSRYGKKSNFKKTVMKIAKAAVMKKAEPKHKTCAHGNIQIFHNVFTYIHLNNSAYMPTQGVGDGQRVGDQINTTGIKVKMVLGQKADRPNVTFKIRAVMVPKGSIYTYSTWFDNQQSNVLLDDLNTDFVKSIANYTWKPHDGSMDNATDEYVYTRTFWIPYRKLIKFGPADAATTHGDDDLCLMVTAFDAYGTLLTDNIAYYQASHFLYYKDP